MSYYDDDDSDEDSCFSSPIAVSCGPPSGSMDFPRSSSTNQLKPSNSIFSIQLVTLQNQIEELKIANANLRDKFNESCLEREALLRKIEERDKEVDLVKNNYRNSSIPVVETDSNLLNGVSNHTKECSFSVR